ASFPATGIFGMSSCKSIAAVLDGTSNTVAFVEGAINPGLPLVPRTKFRGVVGVTALPLTAVIYDASSNPAATLQGIQACSSVWQTGTGGSFNYQRGAEWAHG